MKNVLRRAAAGHRRTLSCRAGVVLIDVTVSLALAALTVLLAHATLTTLLDTTARAAAHREEAIRAAAIRRQLVSWIRSAVITGDPRYWEYFDKSASAQGLPDDLLSFVTLAPDPFTSARTVITLVISRDSASGGPGLVALAGRPEAARVGAPTDEANVAGLPVLHLLVPGAQGFAVRHLYSVAGGRSWTPDWRSSTELPEVTELSIVGDAVPAPLRAPLFVVLGSRQ